MKLDEVHTRYADATRRASEIGRQLTFAGIAIVWLFSGGQVTPRGIFIPKELQYPGGLLVVSLLLDLLHALYMAAAYGIIGRLNERRGNEKEIDYPSRVWWVPNVLYWAKFVALAAAYIWIAVYVGTYIY